MYNKLNKSAKFNREKISGGKISELFSVKKEYWLVRDSQNYENNYKPDINSARIHHVINIAKIDVFTSDEINSDLDRTSQIINSNVNLTRNFLKETRYGYIDFSHLKDLPLIDENEELIEYLLTENDYSSSDIKITIDSRGETFWKINRGRTFQDASKTIYAEITLNKIRDEAPVNIRENFFYGEKFEPNIGIGILDIFQNNGKSDTGKWISSAIFSVLQINGYFIDENKNRTSSFKDISPLFLFENMMALWAHPITEKKDGNCNLLSEWAFQAFHNWEGGNHRNIKLIQTPGIKVARGLRNTATDYNDTADGFRLISEEYMGYDPNFDITNAIIDIRWIASILMNIIIKSKGVLFIEDTTHDVLTNTDGYSSPYYLENHKENELQILRKVKYQSMVKSLGDRLPGPFGAITSLFGKIAGGISSLFGGTTSGEQETGISDYDPKDGESNLHYWIAPIHSNPDDRSEPLQFFKMLQKVEWAPGSIREFEKMGLVTKEAIEYFTGLYMKEKPKIAIDNRDDFYREVKTILIGGLFYEHNLSISFEGQFIFKYNVNLFFHTEENNFTQTQIIL